MSRKQQSIVKQLAVAAALAFGASSVALADDSSIGRFGGDSYAYFNNQPIDKSPSPWRQANPQGTSSRVLQFYSSTTAGQVWRLDKPVFTSIASDPTFKQMHPSGLTERELQAASSSSLAMWELPARSGAGAATSNVARSPGTEPLAGGLAPFLRPGSGKMGASNY